MDLEDVKALVDEFETTKEEKTLGKRKRTREEGKVDGAQMKKAKAGQTQWKEWIRDMSCLRYILYHAEGMEDMLRCCLPHNDSKSVSFVLSDLFVCLPVLMEVL
jgi:hypothetical protein